MRHEAWQRIVYALFEGGLSRDLGWLKQEATKDTTS